MKGKSDKFNLESNNKTTSHFEQFLQSKSNNNTNSYLNEISSFMFNFETKFPFLKELNLNPKFIDSVFMKRKLEQNEFLEKIKENCSHSIDSNTLNLMYEHYSSIFNLDALDENINNL